MGISCVVVALFSFNHSVLNGSLKKWWHWEDLIRQHDLLIPKQALGEHLIWPNSLVCHLN